MTFPLDTLHPRAPSPAAVPRELTRADHLRRTAAAFFAALDDHMAKHHSEAFELYQVIVGHVRSACPSALLVETGPVLLQEPACGHEAEIEKLTQEIDVLRPIYVAALEWRESMLDHWGEGDYVLDAANKLADAIKATAEDV